MDLKLINLTLSLCVRPIEGLEHWCGVGSCRAAIMSTIEGGLVVFGEG